jgi:hypothetical protein
MSGNEAASEPITMALMGGLGNQLFQFATGLEVATRAQTSLVLDLSWFAQRFRRAGGVILRPYELGAIADGVKTVEPSGARSSMRGHVRDVVLRRWPSGIGPPPGRLIYESAPHFESRVLEATPGTRLSGYFASWRYFPNVADEVRARIRLAASDSDWVAECASRADYERPIGIHVRRGDYLKLSSTYGHLAPTYYKRSLALLHELGVKGPVWLFSDEPAAAQAWLGDSVTVDRVVAADARRSSVDHMIEMSQCSALVIANSSYSWWAAFLADRRGRYVIAPRPIWGNADISEPRDALLPDWLTLDARDFPG